MRIFVDANVVVYARSMEKGSLPERCREIIRAIGEGLLEARTSVAVLEEIWHLELRGRPTGLDGVAADAYTLFTPLLAVTDEIVRDALELDGGSLGANDRIHVATCRANDIEAIVSTDAGFDGIASLRRIDPLDRDALASLMQHG